MLYYIFRPIIHIAFKVYFRKIYISNKDRIPEDGAIIFALNHPTAFLDPMIIAVFQMRIVHFMLRGDLFDKKIVIWILNSFKMIPIFRFRDGFGSMKKNTDTFQRCYKMLSEGKHIVIMSEGQTLHEKRLRPIQKGTARLATGSFETYGNDKISIIPVGINFTDSVAFRSELMVDFGTPIRLSDYREDLAANPRRAIKKITDEITRQLKEKVVHINQDEDAPHVNTLLEIRRNDRKHGLFPVVKNTDLPMKEEVNISRKVNELADEVKAKLFGKIENYNNLLAKSSVADFGVKSGAGICSLHLLKSILLLIPAVAGFVIYALPFYAAKYIADKNVTVRMEFYSSVRMAALAILTALYSFVVIIVLELTGVMHWYQSILLLPILGMSAVYFEGYFRKWWQEARFSMLNNSTKKEILDQRQQLVDFINNEAL